MKEYFRIDQERVDILREICLDFSKVYRYRIHLLFYWDKIDNLMNLNLNKFQYESLIFDLVEILNNLSLGLDSEKNEKLFKETNLLYHEAVKLLGNYE